MHSDLYARFWTKNLCGIGFPKGGEVATSINAIGNTEVFAQGRPKGGG